MITIDHKFINWSLISNDSTLSIDFIRKYQNYLYWDNLSRNLKMTDEFVEEFQDKINWAVLCQFKKLSLPFMRKFANKLNWSRVSIYQKLTKKFIEEFKDKLDWNDLSAYQRLDETFIEKYQDRVNWNIISSNQTLSEDFIRKHKSQVNWKNITIFQKLSENFIREFKDYVDWECISYKHNLSFNFIYEFKDKLKPVVLTNTNLTIKELEILRKYLHTYDLYDRANIILGTNFQNNEDFCNDLILNYDKEPEKYDKLISYYIREKECFIWNKLSSKKSLSKKFIEKYYNNVNWNMILNNSSHKDKDFLVKFITIPTVFHFLYTNGIITCDELEIY